MMSSRAEQMARDWLVPHPYLFALFPVLFLFAHNADKVYVGDVVAPLAVVSSFTLAATVGLNAVLRDIRKTAIIVTGFLLVFFLHGHLRTPFLDIDTGIRAIDRHPDQVVLFITVPLWIAVIVAVVRARGGLLRVTTVLNWVGVVLVAFQLVTAGYTLLARSAGPSQQGEIETAAMGERHPDIYYIIVDGYGRRDILMEKFGYDNSSLIGFLEQSGFYVAAESRSNYAQTLQSLTSALNMSYLQELGSFDPGSGDRMLLSALFQDNRLFRFLRSAGYEIVTFNSGYNLTELRDPDVRFAGDFHLPEFHEVILSTTPLSFFVRKWASRYARGRTRVRYAFNKLGELEGVESPHFVFAHINVPHPPFLFTAEGEERQPRRHYCRGDGSHWVAMGCTRDEYREGYAQQVAYVSTRLQEMIASILERSGDDPPVIVVQGDHGPGLGLDWDNAEETDFRERFAILNAYFFPGVESPPLYPTITPINTFRVLLNEYFGADMELLADESYFSVWDRPYRFIPAPEERER